MRRRDVMALLGSAALAGPLAARARSQPAAKLPRIGFVEAGSRQANQAFLDAFRDGLRALGWVEGRNIAIIDRWAEARNEDLPRIIAELLRSDVDILVTAAAPATLAAKRATSVLPIVQVGVPDPVGLGTAMSLARPGGNVTGLSSLSVDLIAKRVQLLHEAVPHASRALVLWNPEDPAARLQWDNVSGSAERLGLAVATLPATTPDDIERLFTRLQVGFQDALFVINDPLTVANRDRIVALAGEHRLPSISGFRGFAVSGGLLSFGTSLPNDFRRAASFVDKILKGAKPSDLPIEQPDTFELVVNLKTAKVLGLELPPALLARADEVIE